VVLSLIGVEGRPFAWVSNLQALKLITPRIIQADPQLVALSLKRMQMPQSQARRFFFVCTDDAVGRMAELFDFVWPSVTALVFAPITILTSTRPGRSMDRLPDHPLLEVEIAALP
jgi:hypothetical protein